MRFIVASVSTFTLILSFFFFLIILILRYTVGINVWLAVGLTITINFFLWLVGPWITDHFNRWFYKVKFLTPAEVALQHPNLKNLIDQVCREHNFPFPKIGIIPDQNPTAFTYGSGRYNSRIILTEGIFTYLSPEESEAVVAHELGHVVNRDFIVMMIASTVVQALYEIYSICIRARGKKSGNLKIIALVAYALYFVSIYLLYFLSRTREYMADTFATKYRSPELLGQALVKIAYGIVSAPDDDSSKRLLNSTRHLGIIDVKNAKHIGVVSYITNQDSNMIAEVIAFDKVSPWAKLSELSSTHPLTGNRLDNLGDIARMQGKSFAYDVDAAIARMKIDKSRLYSGFAASVLVYFAPHLLVLLAILTMNLIYIPGAIGLGMLLQLFFIYPPFPAKASTVLDAMRNPYASPLYGQPIRLAGKVIGRGVPGFIFGEDMMLQDNTGMVFLNYNSLFGFVGNLFFALKKIRAIIGNEVEAEGWFYRSLGSAVTLRWLKTGANRISSHPVLWRTIIAVILIGVSLYYGGPLQF